MKPSLRYFLLRVVFLQMTGLDIDNDKIMEVSCVITDSDLNIIATQPEIVVHQPPELLNNMNDWCIRQHGNVFLFLYYFYTAL